MHAVLPVCRVSACDVRWCRACCVLTRYLLACNLPGLVDNKKACKALQMIFEWVPHTPA